MKPSSRNLLLAMSSMSNAAIELRNNDSNSSLRSKPSPEAMSDKTAYLKAGNRSSCTGRSGFGGSRLANLKTRSATSSSENRRTGKLLSGTPCVRRVRLSSALKASSFIVSLRRLVCVFDGRGASDAVPMKSAPRRDSFKLPPTIVEDAIAGIAFVIICVAGYFIAWGGLT